MSAATRRKRDQMLDGGLKADGWFETQGPLARSFGWPVYPEKKSDKRRPSTAGGKSIKPVTDHRMDRDLPPIDLVAAWAMDPVAFSQNTALMTGDAAGVFVIDADIRNPAKAETILAIADEVIGRTPFVRVCNDPKMALVFRRPVGKLQIKRKVLELIVRTNPNEADQIEIKDGTALTIGGRHITTGRDFRWVRECSPFTHGPDEAPVATEVQVLEFVRRVHLLFPIAGYDKFFGDTAPDNTGVEYADTDVADVRIPRMRDGLVPDNGVVDTNRRMGFLLPRSSAWVVWNAGIVTPADGNGGRRVSIDGCRLIAKHVIDEASAIIRFDNEVTSQNLPRIVLEMVKTAAAKLVSGDFKPVGSQRICETVDKGKPNPLASGVLQRGDEFAWLPTTLVGMKGVVRSAPPNAELEQARALIGDRAEMMAETSRKVRRAIDSWLSRLADWDPDSDVPPPTLLLKAPTGAGKTTALLQGIARWKQSFPNRPLGPILMLLPSYENIDELSGREDLGVWTSETEHRSAEIMALAGGLQLKVMTFKGKLASGCQYHDEVEALQKRGISSAGMCYSKKREMQKDEDGREVEVEVEKFCRFNPLAPDFDTALKPCRNIAQRFEIPTCDLILSPNAFIHTNIPKPLKNVAAVVIDEKIWDKVSASATIPLSTFERVRSAPPRTKAERSIDAKFDTEVYLDSRDRAAAVLMAAVRWREDPAVALLDHYESFSRTKGVSGETLLEHTLNVTGRTQKDGLEVEPGMPMVDVTALVSKPKSEQLGEEHRVWLLVQERLLQIKEDRLGNRKPEAKGKTDSRLLFITEELENGEAHSLRIAWRRKRNFEHHPTLFLDASGNAEILGKFWGREIPTYVVEAQPHARVLFCPDVHYSKSGILPRHDDEDGLLRFKALRRTLMRDALYTVSAMYGFGGVVTASALSVRTFLHDGWAAPENLSAMHYGAIRGLDYAKRHVAAISIGSLTLSPRDLDSYVATLTYDDEKPEMPIDAFGNGRLGPTFSDDKIGPNLVPREYPLRDGGMLRVDGIPEPTGRWAKLIQEQVREEELAQFVGRLRPVYRTGRAPVWLVMGKVLPAGVIIDQVADIGDIARPFGRSSRPLEAVRQSGGLADEFATIHPAFDVATRAGIAKMMTAFENPRVAEGFHEITYVAKPERGQPRVERKAYVSAISTTDPLATFRSQSEFAFELLEARVSREVRKIDFAIPAKISKIDEILGTRKERQDFERENHSLLYAAIDCGDIEFDDKRLGIPVDGLTIDGDSFISYRQMTDVKMQYAKSAPNSSSLQNEVVAESVQTDPVTVAWHAEGVPVPANSDVCVPEPVSENILVLADHRAGSPGLRGFARISRRETT